MSWTPLTRTCNNWSRTKQNRFLRCEKKKKKQKVVTGLQNCACIYTHLWSAMVDVNRSDEDGNWRAFALGAKLPGKQAPVLDSGMLAIGVTPEYVVAVSGLAMPMAKAARALRVLNRAAPLLFGPLRAIAQKRTVVWNAAQRIRARAGVYWKRTSRFAPVRKKPTRPLFHLLPWCAGQFLPSNHSPEQKWQISRWQRVRKCFIIWNTLAGLCYRPGRKNITNSIIPHTARCPITKPACLAKFRTGFYRALSPTQHARIYVPLEIDGSIGAMVFGPRTATV